MAKKDYKSPKMEEVAIQVESLIASGSCAGQYMVPGGCTQCDDPLAEDYAG